MRFRGAGFADLLRAQASSLVRRNAIFLINGAAKMTTGSISSQATSHDLSQFEKNNPLFQKDRLAIPAAMADVSPDCKTPKT